MVNKDSEIKITEENIPPYSETPDLASPLRTRVFMILVCINILLNYDTGVIPASLNYLQSTLKLSFQQQAAIGSLVYIGLCTASLIVSIIFQRFSARKVLILMLFLNCLFCLLFSICRSPLPMYFSRFGMGFTQAFYVIYAPVWTNEFAPPSMCTRWMGILQCAVPLGVVFGYSVASLFNSINSGVVNWRFAIQVQAILEIPLMIALKFTDSEDTDIVDTERLVASGEHSPRGEEEIRIDSISLVNFPSFCQQMRMLAKNWVFVLLTLSLCCLFFVVSGIQYWVTLYMYYVLDAEKLTIVIGFAIISTTAPILGVLTGGYTADYFGGYKGKNVLRAMKICLVFGLLAFSVSIPSGYVQSIIGEILLLWLLLFFGGCVVPSATGIIVNTMPKELQSSSSAVSQLVYNLGGYFMAPVLSGLLMDSIPDKKNALTMGFRFCLSFSLLSLVFALLTYLAILRKEKLENEKQDNDCKYNEYIPEEVQNEIARRVMPLSLT